MRKILTLASGGVDSMTLLFYLRDVIGVRPHALFVDYGQPAFRMEWKACHTICGAEGIHCMLVKTFKFPVAPDGYTVFARNMQLLSIALAQALALSLDGVAIGCNADDKAEFPDCRRDFLEAMQAGIQRSTGLELYYPFSSWKKGYVQTQAAELKVPVELCWSCYGDGPEPCGTCLSCKQRDD